LDSGLHMVTVPSISEIDGTYRLRFQNWGDGSTDLNRVMNVSSDVSLKAVYVKQFKLTIDSPYPSSGEGWYDQNTTVTFSTNASPHLANNYLSVMTFDGWYDENGTLITTSRTGTMILDSSHVVEARWHRDYYTIPVVFLLLLSLIGAFMCYWTLKD